MFRFSVGVLEVINRQGIMAIDKFLEVLVENLEP